MDDQVNDFSFSISLMMIFPDFDMTRPAFASLLMVLMDVSTVVPTISAMSCLVSLMLIATPSAIFSPDFSDSLIRRDAILDSTFSSAMFFRVS